MFHTTLFQSSQKHNLLRAPTIWRQKLIEKKLHFLACWYITSIDLISSFLLCSRGIVSCGVSSRGGQARGSLGRLLGLAETAGCCHQSLHRGWVSSIQSRLSSSSLASIQKRLKDEAEFSFILSLSVVQSKLSRQLSKLGSGTKQCRL